LTQGERAAGAEKELLVWNWAISPFDVRFGLRDRRSNPRDESTIFRFTPDSSSGAPRQGEIGSVMDTQIVSTKRISRKRGQKKDSERTKADILAVATKEFADHGLSGARIDTIAAQMRTSKRMIYYYFGGKEGLYLAVLEKAYSDIRAVEATLPLESLDPVEALRRLVEQTFENDDANEDFIRLVAIENIHLGRHFEKADSLRKINSGVINTIARILNRGKAVGKFRDDLDAVDIHMAISALCFFRVSNRHTFGKIFDVDLSSPHRRRKHKRMIVDAVLRLVRKE
jgi:AcrR family transcriptional regulator